MAITISSEYVLDRTSPPRPPQKERAIPPPCFSQGRNGAVLVVTLQPTDHGLDRVHAHREELVERIGRAILADGTIQPLPGLYLSRASVPLQPVHSVLEPSVCVIAQGS